MAERLDFPSREDQASALAAAVAGDLRTAITARGRASLAVPGGTTPAAFLEALSKQALSWSAVTVTLTDERCLPSDSPRSNQGLLRASLLRNQAIKASFQPLYEEGESLAAIGRRLASELLPLDVCVVGMGEDGHTASLFPEADHLEEALAEAAPALVALSAPGAPEPRVTLSARVLREAGKAYLLIAGASKLTALEHAEQEGSISAAPIRVILRRKGETAIYYAE